MRKFDAYFLIVYRSRHIYYILTFLSYKSKPFKMLYLTLFLSGVQKIFTARKLQLQILKIWTLCGFVTFEGEYLRMFIINFYLDITIIDLGIIFKLRVIETNQLENRSIYVNIN